MSLCLVLILDAGTSRFAALRRLGRIRALTGVLLGVAAVQMPLAEAAHSLDQRAALTGERLKMPDWATTLLHPEPLLQRLSVKPPGLTRPLLVAGGATSGSAAPSAPEIPAIPTPDAAKPKAAGASTSGTAGAAPKADAPASPNAPVAPAKAAPDTYKAPSVESTPAGVIIYRGSGAP